MSNNLTDILVQQFRKSFQLNLIEAQLVQTSVFLAYGTMAVPAALLMRRFGYKVGLVTGLCLFALGTLLFWPAAVIGHYAPFLVALFAVGCGSSILETAANPFIAQFGHPSTSERRLNFAQAFNPPGSITGVLFGTWFIFSGIEKSASEVASMKATGTYAQYLHLEIMRVVPTYVALGLVVLLLAFFIGRMRFPATLDAVIQDEPQGRMSALFAYPHLLLAVVAQFFYVGAQVGTWSTFIPYLKAYTTTTEKSAGYMLTGTLIALAAGRICSTPLMRFISAARMTAIYALVNVLLVFIGIAHPGLAGGYSLLASSFFMSIMFPTIFALGIKGLGPLTKLAGSLIVMSVIGGAIIPPLMGVITRKTGSVAYGYWLPLAGYIVVALYGLFGSSIGTTVHEVNTAPEVL
jgi:FHS family L-fucose permease-like MFS transporter